MSRTSTSRQTMSSNSYSLLTVPVACKDRTWSFLYSVLGFSDAANTRKKGNTQSFRGLERPTSLLGSRRLPKVAVAQPNGCFARVKIDCAPCANLRSDNFRPPLMGGTENGERGGDLCLLCTVQRPHCSRQRETNGSFTRR